MRSLFQFIAFILILGSIGCSSSAEREQKRAVEYSRLRSNAEALYSSAVAMADLDSISQDAYNLEHGWPQPHTRDQKIKALEQNVASVYLARLGQLAHLDSAKRDFVTKEFSRLSSNQYHGRLIVQTILRHLKNASLGISESRASVIQDFQTLKYAAATSTNQ